jgi:hypothetical protein
MVLATIPLIRITITVDMAITLTAMEVEESAGEMALVGTTMVGFKME